MRKAILILMVLLVPVSSNAVADNSNLWPVHRDDQFGFHISYPPSWVIVPPKSNNVRFSINPPGGAGNCNVMVRPNAELNGMSQAALNLEIEWMPNDQGGWAEYIGIPPSQVRVIQSRRAIIHAVPVLLAVVETSLENLEGKYTRKQNVMLTFTPGVVWSLNCGASTFKADEARARFAELQPTFSKIFGSFGFLK